VCSGCDQHFFCGEFLPLGEKKKGLGNLTKEILEFVFKSPYLEERKR